MSVKSWGLPFQQHVAACLLRVPGFLARFHAAVRPSFFENPALAAVISNVFKVYEETGVLPSRPTLTHLCSDPVVVAALYKENVADAPAVAVEVGAFCKFQAVRLAVFEAAENFSKGEVDGIVDNIRRATQVGDDLYDLGVFTRGADLAAAQERISGYLNPEAAPKKIPTGIRHLDICMHGGVGPGEFGIILGRLKRGKSQILLNMAVSAMFAGKNVVYYTLELSERNTQGRIDRRVAGCPGKFFRENPKKFCSELEAALRPPNYADILVKKYPNKGVSVDGLEAHMTRCADEGFEPEVVFIDYGDLLKPPRSRKDVRFELGETFSEIRRVADEWSIPIWTASQIRRAAFDKRVYDDGDVAEDISKLQTCDYGVTWCVTDDEMTPDPMTHMSSGRLYTAAMREGGNQGRVISCITDWSRSYIESVEFETLQRRDKGRGEKNRESQVADARAAAAQRTHQTNAPRRPQ